MDLSPRQRFPGRSERSANFRYGLNIIAKSTAVKNYQLKVSFYAIILCSLPKSKTGLLPHLRHFSINFIVNLIIAMKYFELWKGIVITTIRFQFIEIPFDDDGSEGNPKGAGQVF